MENTALLKDKFHRLIDEIDSEDLLRQFYEALSATASDNEGALWNDLSPSQQKSILEAYNESEETTQRLSHEAVVKKYQQWRTS
ncbi:hypothetical protein GCM10023189_38720 [Nibrella saemangeumensis]|uniref:Addiction module component n=1 Tax=Nibrella saemangeumensis TaxID=1084526 RepID=A0ABP8NAB9_9BACT